VAAALAVILEMGGAAEIIFWVLAHQHRDLVAQAVEATVTRVGERVCMEKEQMVTHAVELVIPVLLDYLVLCRLTNREREVQGVIKASIQDAVEAVAPFVSCGALAVLFRALQVNEEHHHVRQISQWHHRKVPLYV
jgi:hypothetical protein